MNRKKIKEKIKTLEIDAKLGIYAKELNKLDNNDFNEVLDALEYYSDTDVIVEGGIIEIVFTMVKPEQFEIDFYHLTSEQYERYL